MGLRSTMLESYASMYRPVTGQDPNYGTTITYSTTPTWTNRPCAIVENIGGAQSYYDQRISQTSNIVWFDTNPMCNTGDRFLVTDRTGTQYYLVAQSQAQPIGRGRLWQVQTEKVTQPGLYGQ